MQSVRYTDGEQPRLEPHEILHVVSSDIGILVICGDEGSHEETSERISAVPKLEIGPEAFKRPLLTHRNAVTTGWKRVGRVSRDKTKARESILEDDLANNVSLSLHNSFCRNRESKVKGLPNQAKRLQEQREWMRSNEQLKAWEEIVIGSDDEEALLRQITVSNASGPSTSKARNTK